LASTKSGEIIATKIFLAPSFARPTCPCAGPPHVSSSILRGRARAPSPSPPPATTVTTPPSIRARDLPGRGGKPPARERRRRVWTAFSSKIASSEFFYQARRRSANLRDSRPGLTISTSVCSLSGKEKETFFVAVAFGTAADCLIAIGCGSDYKTSMVAYLNAICDDEQESIFFR
jgi:hypothetical protein